MMTLKLERADIMAEREDKLKELEKITGETVIRPEVPDYIAKNQNFSHSRQNTEETDNTSEMMKERKKKMVKMFIVIKDIKKMMKKQEI